jgi:glycosyltransferase involved in cell wall biosynthesis
MKILLATYWPIPHLGGVWPLMNQIKERLELKGHEVDLLGESPDGESFHILNKNIQVPKSKLLPLISKNFEKRTFEVLQQIPWSKEIGRNCMELAAAYFGLSKYDIIHTQDVISTRAISRVKPKKTPLIASLHGLLSQEMIEFEKILLPNQTHNEIKQSLKCRYHSLLDTMGAKSADIVHTSCEWTRNILKSELFIPEEKIVTFQYGINIEAFIEKQRIPTEIERPSDKKVIITAGRLVHIKGFQYLLHALAKLKEDRDDWVCWIAGDGYQLNYLKKLTMELGLQQNVTFLGQRNDIPALLRLADVFVLPSLVDNMPLAVIEAQLSGLPVIITNAGGLPEMVNNGIDGIVVPVAQIEPLYQNLKILLSNSSFKNMLAVNAKQRAATYWSIENMIENLTSVYKNLSV